VPEFLYPVLFGLGTTAVFFGGSALQARRRRGALGRGEDVTFRVRLAGARPPYPSDPRRGRLRVGPSGLTWTALMGALGLDLTGTGIRPVGQREGRAGEGAGDAEIVLTAADGMGVALRLLGNATTLEQLDEVLRARGLPDQPAPVVELRHEARRRPGAAQLVAAGLVGLALLGGAFTAWARVAGVEVTATVVSEPDSDDYCTVQWVDPRDGRTKRNGADCYWDVGDEVSFVALPAPLAGEIVETEDTWAWAVLSGLVGLSAGVPLGLHRWRRRRDARRPTADQPWTAPPAPPPVLTADQLGFDTVSEALRLRAAAEGWAFERDHDAEASSRRPWSQRFPVVLSASWPLLGGLLFGLLVGWTSFAGLWASAGPTETVVATVHDDPVDTLPFGPGDLEVSFPVRGRGSSTTLVAVTGLPHPRPETIAVAYDLDNPDRARARQYDGAARGGAIGGGLILAGLGFAAWRTHRVLSVARDERRARSSSERRFVPYVLVPDGEEELHLLLFDAGRTAPPRHVIVLAEDVRGQVPAAGTAEVRGGYEPGGIVVPLVDGVELATASRLLEIAPEDVLEVVNNVTPGYLG
jgi:hypothetical protein